MGRVCSSISFSSRPFIPLPPAASTTSLAIFLLWRHFRKICLFAGCFQPVPPLSVSPPPRASLIVRLHIFSRSLGSVLSSPFGHDFQLRQEGFLPFIASFLKSCQATRVSDLLCVRNPLLAMPGRSGWAKKASLFPPLYIFQVRPPSSPRPPAERHVTVISNSCRNSFL